MAANDDDKGMLQARDKKIKEEPGLKKKEPLFKPLDEKGVVERIAKRLLEVETLGEEEFSSFLSAPAVPR
jgi:hypothetical protein